MGGAPQKKSSTGLVIGIIAGLALVVGIGIAAIVFSGGSKDNGTAANALPPPNGTTVPTPLTVTPANTPAMDQPAATGTIAAPTEPAQPANNGGKPGKPTKPGATATATATATAALTATTSSTTTTTPPKGPHPGLDDDRK